MRKIKNLIMVVLTYAALAGGLTCMTICNIMSVLENHGLGQMPAHLGNEYEKGFGLLIVGLILMVAYECGEKEEIK